jgi:gliding motility-associated-like protein
MLNDPQADSGPTLTSGDTGSDNVMGVGETWVYAATSTVVQADLDAGELVNTITASGTPAQGTLADVSDVALVPASIFPDWVMVKVATAITYDSPGETLNYLILLTNTGNETITAVTVSDTKATTGPTYSSGDVDADNVLDPGETWTYNASYQTTQADVDNGAVSNTANATGTPAQGSLHGVSASATVSATLNPAWTMTHVVTPLTYSAPGNTILYQVTLANTGNVSLTNVLLTESKVTSAVTLLSGDLDSDLVLDVGESWVYSASYDATQADLDTGSFEALASATATPAGGSLASLSDSQAVTAIQSPDWTIQKVALTPTYTVPGNTVTYQVRLRNKGNVTINTVSLTESNTTTPNVLISGDTNADNKLDVNEEWVFESTYLVTLADVTAGSVASVTTATGVPAGGILAELSVTAEATAVQAPAWSMAKTSDQQQYDELNEVITYTIEVSNTGNIPISITSVSDDKVTTPPAYTAGDSNADGLLSLGEKWIYTATYVVAQHDLIVGSITATATAVGTPQAGALSPVSASTSVLASWKASSSGIDLDPSEGLSPNGDGINDFWWVKNIEAFPENKVSIYGANGSLIYEVRGYNNSTIRFEGTANQTVTGSQNLTSGTYYYLIEIAGQNMLSGYFTLLK